ncbi:mannose-1-phosphate guanylyltransferase [Pseudomonas sp. R37(2017)]|uniref:mannose-1-phosphate guanylyltransferase n=1 Tax=Pseudomonas sp. R37(2017) TaxID=1981685 RepID=UPI00117AC6EB|nr:mannose-1-phosphate guanylyltransferase [Pseudomonas sp. R37(2017)]
MKASRSSIDFASQSLDSIAPGNIGLGQKFADGGSGLMAWLRSYEPQCSSPQSKWLVERIGLFPSSGNIRCTVRNTFAVLEHLRSLYIHEALDVEEKGGLSMTFTEWRFRIDLLDSTSEILLTVESRGDISLMKTKTAELLEQIN